MPASLNRSFAGSSTEVFQSELPVLSGGTWRFLWQSSGKARQLSPGLPDVCSLSSEGSASSKTGQKDAIPRTRSVVQGFEGRGLAN